MADLPRITLKSTFECALSYDQKSRINIHECEVFNGGCSHTCVEEEGGYYCSCPHDHRLNQTDSRTCYEFVCGSGYEVAPAGDRCIDIDECQLDIDDCEDHCNNTIGAFECFCDENRHVVDGDPSKCTDSCLYSACNNHNHNIIKVRLNVVAKLFTTIFIC
ncbi:hypothetical protein CAPTEDRAFT_212346 [Capitella teleta]|uniref:EGF-like domain-containing protein n=1 Tax=Capitella teleta TaxID=283909 RepID=R7VFF6_CAPTE|nr:hypothetical protein CAPTEDRAFT_212346 [Capitella teleta]|eukprot:ELU14410.1 hypothetical protein CAPTEDRAFT_212346 [Capitella teleta]